jgi:hypothetical protein
LNVILLACGVKALCIVATDDKNKTALGVESREIGPSEQQRTLVLQLLLHMIVLKHPIAAYIILVTPANAEHFSFIGYERSAEFWN